jgi:hypothetical protein
VSKILKIALLRGEHIFFNRSNGVLGINNPELGAEFKNANLPQSRDI